MSEQFYPHLSSIRIPGPNDRVYKEECSFTFDTPFSPHGLYTNLKTHHSVGAALLQLDAERSGCRVYLHQRWVRVPREVTIGEAPENGTPTVFAIGVAGGFQVGETQFDIEKHHAVIIVPEDASDLIRVEYPNATMFPEKVILTVNEILRRDDSNREVEFKAWQDEYAITRYADQLIQLPPNRVISPNPAEWKCDHCDLRENLWLNLSTGYIGGGRRNPDGSGGCGAALEHFVHTGSQYPLCVKLGTITPDGADVYSYAADENDMVVDPKLADHLAHWGINMMRMKKTEKTVAELNIDLNNKYEWSAITESGKDLVLVSGAGLIGLRNLGNTCYINSFLQLLFTIPEFSQHFNRDPVDLLLNSPANPVADFSTQLSKVAFGLLTDHYKVDTSAQQTISDSLVAPKMLKTIVGREHPEFSSTRQQDIHDYYQHFLKILKLNCMSQNGQDLTRLFLFDQEERIECLQSHLVRYTTIPGENTFALSIPTELATNKAEVDAFQERKKLGQVGSDEPEVLPVIPFDQVLSAFGSTDYINDWRSPATGQLGNAAKTTRFKTFPPYLFVQLRRYVPAEDWSIKKLNALVPVPEELDLTALRGHGLQPGESELPQDTSSAAAAPQPNASIVEAIASMGFSENAAKRAAIATKNVGIEEASNWLFGHMEDADINDPIADTSSAATAGTGAQAPVDEMALMTVMSLGISQSHAERALRATNGDIERAVDWALSHDENDTMDVAPTASSAAEQGNARLDGSGHYQLVGFASHIGNNTDSGHYVCHIKKDGKWVIFNDEKVALSENPPLGLGYLYLFQRVDQHSQ